MKDWLSGRQSFLMSENAEYLRTVTVILSSYVAALIVGAGWMLSGSLLSSSASLQMKEILGNYPNAAMPFLLVALVSVAYITAITAVGYLFLSNRLQISWIQWLLYQSSPARFRTPPDDSTVRFVLGSLFAFVCLLLPWITASVIIVKYPDWTSATSVPRVIDESYQIVFAWFLVAIIGTAIAASSLAQRLYLLFRQYRSITDGNSTNVGHDSDIVELTPGPSDPRPDVSSIDRDGAVDLPNAECVQEAAMVRVNLASGIYFRPEDPWFVRLRNGVEMEESVAIARGYRRPRVPTKWKMGGD